MALFNNLGKEDKEEEEPVVEYNFFLQMNQVSLFQRGRSDSKVECINFFLCNVQSWGWSNSELIWWWRWWWEEEGERVCQQWYGNYHSRPNIRECLPKALQSFTLTIVRLIVIAFARGFASLNQVSHSKQFFNEFVNSLYKFLSLLVFLPLFAQFLNDIVSLLCLTHIHEFTITCDNGNGCELFGISAGARAA